MRQFLETWQLQVILVSNFSFHKKIKIYANFYGNISVPLHIYIYIKNSLRATHRRHVINIGQSCLSYRFTVWLWYKFADGVEILFNGIFRLIVLKEYICGLRKPSTYIAFNVPALQIKGKNQLQYRISRKTIIVLIVGI